MADKEINTVSTSNINEDLTPTEAKQYLVAQIERSRANISRNFKSLTDCEAIKQKMRTSVRKNAPFWVPFAGLLGGLVGWKLFGKRKEKVIYVDLGTGKKMDKGSKNLFKAEKRGLLLTALGFVVSIVQPAATAFFSKRLATMMHERER